MTHFERNQLILSKGRTLARFTAELPESKPIIERALVAAGKSPDQILLLPLYVKGRSLAVIVGADVANVIDVVLIE